MLNLPPRFSHSLATFCSVLFYATLYFVISYHFIISFPVPSVHAIDSAFRIVTPRVCARWTVRRRLEPRVLTGCGSRRHALFDLFGIRTCPPSRPVPAASVFNLIDSFWLARTLDPLIYNSSRIYVLLLHMFSIISADIPLSVDSCFLPCLFA